MFLTIRTRFVAFVLVACAGVAVTPETGRAGPIHVATELSLLVDVSGSIDSNEFALQRQGYANAFNSAAVQNLIASTPGGIAVNLVYWSGANEQKQVVGWTHLTDAASATAFANKILSTTRQFDGLTAPGSALNYAVPLFASNDFTSDRQVIDVSGDGARNDGADTVAARNAALAAGIDTINGLPILGSENGLQAFYELNVAGGTNSFTLPAANFNDFNQAVERKLYFEISGTTPPSVPEPATLAVFGALAGFGALGYRLRRKTAGTS